MRRVTVTKGRAWLALFLLPLFYWTYGEIHLVRTHGFPVRDYPVIDEGSYIRGARTMAESGSWFYSPDGYHSVGMQILGAAVWRTTGEAGFRGAVYRLNFNLWLLTLALVLAIAYLATQSALVSAFALALVASSRLLSEYIFLVQYEVVTAFLCTALTLFFLVFFRTDKKWWLAAMGATVGALIVIRVHFGVFVPLFLILLLVCRRPAFRREASVFVGAFLLVCAPIQVLYTIKRGKLFLFQQNVTSLTFLHGLAENSRGFNSVRLSKEEWGDHGLGFVVRHPAKYADLLKRRAEIFVGLTPDNWFVESGWTLRLMERFAMADETARRWVVYCFFGTLLLWAGLARTPAAWSLLFPLVVVVLPQLIIDASTRFLIPALPVLCVAFAAFWGRAASGIVRHVLAWRKRRPA